jgi:adenylylsulfate kinase-like enzyme
MLLAPVHDAEHTRSGRVARCLNDTRKDVIEKIKRSVDKSDARICWLKGPAGSGKSAISQTVAEWYAAKNRLAARLVPVPRALEI